MGAEPWSCFVPYQPYVAAALEAARAQEFEAGRYRILDPADPPATIEEACLRCAESGTGSVLDMTGVADEPRGEDAGNWMMSGELPDSFCMAAPLSQDQLLRLYGTDRPTHREAAANHEFYEWIDRGLGIYVVVYDEARETPIEIFFAGYSFD